MAGPGVLFRVLRRSLPTYSQHPSEPHHFLAKLAVHPAYQRRGLARALLEDLHDWSVESGSAGVALDNSNPENVRFYESFGYRVTHHARIANVDLAEQVGLSPSPCARRVKGLEEGNTISRYVTLINQKQVGLPVSVFISVTLEKQVEKSLEDFERAMPSP